MSLIPRRPGRLRMPLRAAAPASPMCRSCSTDRYLRIRLFLPFATARTAPRGLRGLAARLLRARQPAGGRVEYFCQKCGARQRHHYPLGWEPSGEALAPREVVELPSLYVHPGESLSAQQLRERQSDATRTPEPGGRVAVV